MYNAYMSLNVGIYACIVPYFVFLCRGSRDKDDEQRACYVSILLCPLQPPGTTPTLDHALSIHFKFDILSPFPSFVPTLSLKIPGNLLKN